MPYATPKTPFTRHHDITQDYKISSKTNLLKTPSDNAFTVYETPVTPRSSTKKKNDVIFTPPSTVKKNDNSQFNGRLLFAANPGRIGSGRSHHKQNLKAPSLTTLLTMAATSSSELEQSDLETDNVPQTPNKQMITEARTPPLLSASEDDFQVSLPKKKINPFVDNEDVLKKELIYVDKFGKKKIEKLSDEEARLLQKTKRRLDFS